MDIRDLRESSSDSDEPSASSHSVHQLHSEDSRNSRDSYLLNNDDPMEEIRFDDWGNNESTEDDSRYESCMLINLDSSHDESLEILSHRVPPLLERIEDSPEENNNDPNNNMDSIESDSLEEAAGGSHDSATDRSRRREYQNVLNVDRALSPQPGCSKDYQPVFVPTPDSSPIEDTMLNKKTRDILGLVQEIDYHSIFNALCKNDTIPVKELKLWDLIPEQSRCDFSEYLLIQEEVYPDNSVVVLENNSELACDTQIETQSTVTNNGAKRGPADDICTVQPKKSSSDTDLSISAEAAVSDNSSPGASSSAEDPDSPTKPVNRGAIPKIRDQPAKKKSSTSYQAFHALLIDAQKSVPIADIYTRTVSPTYEKSQQKTISTTEEIHVEQQKMKSLDANAKPPIFVAKAPFLKYRAPKFAISRPNNTESEKTKVPIHVQRQKETEYRSQQSLQKTAASTSNIVQPEKSKASSVGDTRYNLAPVPINVQRQKETVYRSQQSQEKSAASRTNITESEKSKASSVGDTRSRNEVENRLQQPLRLATKPMAASTPTSVAVGPNNQQRLTAIDKQLIRQATVTPKSVAASTPITIGPKYQQRQMEMGNRLQQQPTSTIAPNHQLGIIRMEYANRSKQQTQIGAASIYHQMPMEMDNPFQQTATICHRMQTANLELPAQTQIPTPAPVKEQSTKRIICKEMYYKLRNIFPNVDRKYIKKLCPPDWGPGDKDAQMAPIIEHLLEAGETLPQEQPIVEIIDGATKNFTQDDLCEFFIGIFPDADPHYLRERALIHLGNDDGIKNFVDSHLEDRNYPTREQYRARLKITEQQRQYTTGFEVKQFLSIIPDPSKHFMDARRKCTHQTVAFEFLKSYFNKLRVTTISRMYTQNQYNLSLTAQSLEILHDELKSKRAGYEMPTADILLLQEIAFVKHKQEINKYIARLKKEEDDEFRTLKALNQLLECQCCYDSECVPSKSSECDNGHIFCNSCIVTGTSAKMGEDQTRIHCFVNCGSEFSLSVLQRVLAPTTFSILLKKRQAAEVIEAGLEGLVSCPFCHFASIPPEGDKIFKCLNPECTKESCRLCKELSHVPLKCDEVIKAEDARHYIEEKMTQALARKCYMCKRAFFKEEGCNKITCPCGAIMCYLCDQPIKDYTHFRGQGSNDRNLCPLYSDTIRLDAVAVCKVAEEAERELLKRNPNINIDTTRLRPDIPRARTGPHMDILNADELPRRAHRVLDLPPL